MSKKLTTGEFISKSKLIHGDKYDYSKVEYVNNHSKVCIICPEHGEFWQSPEKHLIGQGCVKCSYIERNVKKTDTVEKFIQKSKKIHGNKYDYSKVNYVNTNTKVCIICPKHGEFLITPNNHLRGKGCPKCNQSKLERDKISFDREISEVIDYVEYDSIAKLSYDRAKVKRDYCMDLIEFFKEVKDNL